MGKVTLYFTILLLVVAVVVLGLHLVNVININIRGTVNVTTPIVIERGIELDITTEKGSEVLDLGVVEIPRNGTIQVRAQLVECSGDFKLLLDGTIEIRSENRVYRISMPCLAGINEPCYRIMAVIPGYDEPMPIEKGKYNITLILKWTASGRGSFYLKITGTYIEAT
ncbi:MAG: hypothetical protein QXN82_01180 [Desulfurococcaceae archaeon]